MRIAFLGDSLTKGIPGSSYFAILHEKLPQHTLVNLGQGGDTVVSLYRRLTLPRFGGPFDIAFLWIGVNDVTAGSPWTFQVVNAILHKPPAKDIAEFRAYYRAALDRLCQSAHRVIAVSPLLKGEDLHNPWQHELQVLASVIEELTSQVGQAEYLDLRTTFAQKLAGKSASNYLPKSVLRVALDTLLLRSNEQVDQAATKRGLYFTLDGIHLNTAGAEIVAEIFIEAINQ